MFHGYQCGRVRPHHAQLCIEANVGLSKHPYSICRTLTVFMLCMHATYMLYYFRQQSSKLSVVCVASSLIKRHLDKVGCFRELLNPNKCFYIFWFALCCTSQWTFLRWGGLGKGGCRQRLDRRLRLRKVQRLHDPIQNVELYHAVSADTCSL
jgi:hypothetical protein